MNATTDRRPAPRSHAPGGVLATAGKTVLLALILTVWIFGSNALWYAVLMPGFYENSQGSWGQVAREDPSIPIVLGSMFTVALLMTLLFRRVRIGPRNRVLAYLGYGVTVGLIYVLPASLYYYGTTDILAFDVMVMDVVWHTIEEGTAGVLLGLLSLLPFFAAVRGRADA